MIILNVELQNTTESRQFVHDTEKRLTSGRIHSALHEGFSVKHFYNGKKLYLSIGYNLLFEWLSKPLGLIMAAVMIYFVGASLWLLIPYTFFFLNEFLMFFMYILLRKGLKKTGYKHLIKGLSHKSFIKGVVHGSN